MKSIDLKLTFDPVVWKELDKVRLEGGFNDVSDVVKQCLRVYITMHSAALSGFDEVTLKNNQTNEQKTLEVGRAPFRL